MSLNVATPQYLRPGQTGGENSPDLVDDTSRTLTAKLRNTPEYKMYVAARAGKGAIGPAFQALQNRARTLGIPEDYTFDPFAGSVRKMTWDEAHSNLSALKYVGMTTGAGLAGAAAVGAIGSGGAAGAASTGAAGTGAAGTGVGIGETAATTGLASGAGLPGAVAAPALTTAGSTLSTVGKAAKLAEVAGRGISGATEAAANRQFAENDADNSAANTNIKGEQAFQDAVIRQAQLGLEANSQNITGEKSYEDTLYNRERLGLDANSQNIQGEQAYQSALQAIARTEADQRSGALKDVYRASVAENPSHSPYNPVPTPGMSDDLRNTLAAVSRQGTERLANPAEYDTRNMRAPVAYQPYEAGKGLPPVKPYTPYAVSGLPAPRPYDPLHPDVSTTGLQTVGNIAGPTLSALAAIAALYGRR